MRIVLVESTSEWPEAFELERDRLGSIFGPLASAIEHIGSTSVPGLRAKPVVDIQVGVNSLEEFERAEGIARLQNAGYLYLNRFEAAVPFRRLFTRDRDGVRLNNLHLVETGHPWFRRHLVFRDYLRANPGARDRYEQAKQQLSKLDWDCLRVNAEVSTASLEHPPHHQLRYWTRK